MPRKPSACQSASRMPWIIHQLTFGDDQLRGPALVGLGGAGGGDDAFHARGPDPRLGDGRVVHAVGRAELVEVEVAADHSVVDEATDDGLFSSVDMAVTISASRAVDPAGHEGIELIADGVLEGDAVLGEQGLQAALGEGGEDVGGTTDQLATDEGLRNRSHGRSLGERGADLAAPVVGLQGGGVDVDRAVGDLAALEELADSLYP